MLVKIWRKYIPLKLYPLQTLGSSPGLTSFVTLHGNLTLAERNISEIIGRMLEKKICYLHPQNLAFFRWYKKNYIKTLQKNQQAMNVMAVVPCF